LRSADAASEAIAQFEQALRLDPRSAEAENDLALELGRDPERLAEAAAHFEKALEIHPNYPEARCNLGVVLDEMGRIARTGRRSSCAPITL
jgi:Flp pilus assembly protein TadD